MSLKGLLGREEERDEQVRSGRAGLAARLEKQPAERQVRLAQRTVIRTIQLVAIPFANLYKKLMEVSENSWLCKNRL